MLAAHQIEDPVIEALERRLLADVEEGVGMELGHGLAIRGCGATQD